MKYLNGESREGMRIDMVKKLEIEHKSVRKAVEGVVWLCVFTLICMWLVMIAIHQDHAVGLFVVRPNVDFFECAKSVHGNYKFYYDFDQEEFRFNRAGETCYVNTMAFREHYIEMFGRKNEIFIGE